MEDDLEALTVCFSRHVAAWFEREGRERVTDRAYLRQMNMAIALTASRWNEFVAGADAVPRMRAWLAEVERRALVRNAQARVEAVRQARAWFEGCSGNA